MPFSQSTSLLINAPLEQVWEALTKPELVKKYFFNTDLVTDWAVGSSIVWRGEWEGKTYEDKGEVMSMEPKKSLSYSYWSSMGGTPDVPENYQTLRYDLEQQNDGVKVTITQGNAPTQEKADDSIKNWNMVLLNLQQMIER